MAGVHCIVLGGGGSPFMDAVGGVITTYTDADGRVWRVHTFNETGTFEVKNPGSPGLNTLRRLVVAGGGGGTVGTGGGAGGGEVIEDTTTALAGSYPIVVGDGGNVASNGQPSSALGITAAGGPRGGFGEDNGVNGPTGSGAGGIFNLPQPARSGGAPTTGFRGGNRGGSTTGRTGGAGGGGMGGPGQDVPGDVRTGGAGGPGKSTNIRGTTERFGAGGGGSGAAGGVGGPGGSGGGGAGGSESRVPAGNGAPNSGSGGGSAGGPDPVAGRGGKGVVILSYRIH